MHNRVHRYTYAWAIVTLLLAPVAGPASAEQIYTVFDSSLDTAVTRYYGPSVHDLLTDNALPPTTEAAAQTPMPSGSLVSMGCVLGVAPGAGSWAFTLRKNGEDTLLAFNINNPQEKGAAQPVSPVALAAGDVVALRVVPTGTPAATNLRCTMLFRK